MNTLSSKNILLNSCSLPLAKINAGAEKLTSLLKSKQFRKLTVVCEGTNGALHNPSTNNSHHASSSNVVLQKEDSAPSSPSSTQIKFSSIQESICELKKGKIVLIIDPRIPDDIGTFIVAGSLVSEETMAFLVNNGSGLIMCPCDPSILDRLNLPVMLEVDPWSEHSPIPFTMTVDLKEGTTTGISASDRALTIRHLASIVSKPNDFRRPGHVIPIKTAVGGCLTREGHAESAVDLARLAGLPPVAATCAVSNPDGTMGQLADLRRLSVMENLCLVSVPDIVSHRKKSENVAVRTAMARLPTKWGEFHIISYTSVSDGIEHVALVKGEVSCRDDVLCRVHSECLTGDIFGSARCDCGPQLAQSLQRVSQAGEGVVVYLRGQEGRGIGIGKKLMAYNLQDGGRDTVEANEDLGLPVDAREYGVSAAILRDLGVGSVRLMTNNPAKLEALKGCGIDVRSRVPVFCPITTENRKYLETKRTKMGHLYASDISGLFGELPEEELP